jgi:ATP-dependent helicase/DNAse subunit B
MAGLLSNGYNSQLASGNLFRQAQEYNDALRQKVEEFNRGTNQFNAEAYNRNSQFNADAFNTANRASAQMQLHAAQAKDDANRWWASNLYGNINGLFDNINQWEKWKRDHNTIAKMYANGLAGTITEDNPMGIGMVKTVTAKGGKLKKKKRGLTI